MKEWTGVLQGPCQGVAWRKCGVGAVKGPHRGIAWYKGGRGGQKKLMDCCKGLCGAEVNHDGLRNQVEQGGE